MRNAKRIVVCGAGPKAAAIAAKAAALSACGHTVPEVMIIERTGSIAANWTGDVGYTSGAHALGTFPEKDVGFPYDSSYGDDVAEYMFANFSWQSYVRSERPIGIAYDEWIDRGRPQPNHADWARYLRWVMDHASVSVVPGNITRMTPEHGRWRIEYETRNGSTAVTADGMVVTGPGSARRVPRQVEHSRVFDGKSFWLNLHVFDELAESATTGERPVCVIGGGETAAAVVVELIATLSPARPPAICIITTQGMIFSRGESFFENRIFSDPSEWRRLTEGHRKTIIERTDRGVFSQATLATIGRARNVWLETARITAIEEFEDERGRSDLYIVGEYDDANFGLSAAAVVVAIGFDPWSFAPILSQQHAAALSDEDERKRIVSAIEWDLTIPTKWVPAPLHVPMLAGVSQGPGFPNLSCLGALADRVLAPYCQRVNGMLTVAGGA